MNMDQHYITLRKHFESIKDNEEFPIKMEQLEVVLSCTRRNAQILVKRMAEEGYIVWKAGRGRGNQSTMLFIQPLDELIFEKAKRLAVDEKLTDAWKLVDHFTGAKIEFANWLHKHLGFIESVDEDTLRFPFYRTVPDLDPTFVHRRSEAHLVNQLFNKLVKFADGKLTPDLAHFWESYDEDSVWRFYLRKGVKFHHGRTLTSKDVEYTFLRSMKYGHYDLMRDTIMEIKPVGKYTIDFILKESNALFADFLCSERYSIVPFELEQINLTRPFSALPIGTGPFRIKKNTDSILQLEAHDEYFGGRPWLDRIEMWVWPNYHRLEHKGQMREDDLYFGGFPAEEPSFNQIQNLEQGAVYLTFNLNKSGPTKNVYFRSAVHHALDREKIMGLGGAKEAPACSFFTDYSQKCFQSDFDRVRAKELLAMSDYKGESLHLYTYVMPSNEQNARWIKEQLGLLGINIEVTILPISELSNPVVLARADFVVAGEVLGIQEDIDLIEMFNFRNGFIYNHLGDAEMELVQECLSLCKRESSSQVRKSHLSSLLENLTQEQKLIFLYHSKQTVQHSKSLSGIIMNGWGNVDYQNIWIKRD
ncbi:MULTISPECIES: ABC transporter substrate-binding protein [unclassified Bacillus (in: firmicutes)]|uniref:ABC transporter substrate-binding protein n=1 Tax=unclassified Bacillus (in: firmicutes) TaxID=185979 RepID=UPI0008F1957E|nr:MULTISPECIES: ABC transporter substrate-binding protein [unclassified Bacillus (in: firmicutes)]SFA69477.1 DNA-binding transcriptional regulator SgrR of sgrS sRNA, contains a MarR-type HTH domain and a solute-binding domain [Bacillus sp. UNCCL13]SFQ58783.1 DNA-binding transcriptional regulator SgrR of sgrS sRNA, contains a MarR-type HTH domain and a solute-binding domain [Bacillus sp. cl95]